MIDDCCDVDGDDNDNGCRCCCVNLLDKNYNDDNDDGYFDHPMIPVF